MAHEVFNKYEYKKCIVERIINPGVYCVSEYERGRSYKKEVERLESLLAKNVEKFSDTGRVTNGEIIAVKYEGVFHRGLFTDVFNRGSKTTYCILLVDHGNTIETDERHIYFIQNKDLKNKKLGSFEVSIHGIQPVCMKLEGDNFLGGILQKRVSNNWSPKAFQFVRNIIEKNPYIFVKTITCNKIRETMSGEIYLIEKPDSVPLSLGEMLCAKGFAINYDISSKSLSQDSSQGDSDIGIEEKIPDRALSRQLQNHEVQKRERSKINNLIESSEASRFPVLHKLESKYRPPLESFKSQSKSVQACQSASLNSSSNNYSSSWILKKCQNRVFTPALHSDTCTVGESEGRENRSPGNFNEGIFRVVQRSIELFNKKKQIESFLYSK